MRLGYAGLTVFGAVCTASIWAQNSFPTAGNVGIGVTSPQQLLDVRGNTLLYDGQLFLGGSNNLWGTAGATQLNGNYASPVAGRLMFGDGSGWKFNFARFGAVDLVTIQDNGNVGIGTTTPAAKLDVQAGMFRIGSSASPQPLWFGGEQLLYFNTDGSPAANGQIIGGMGFYGFGASHGQFDYRAGKGFELLDVSADGPSPTHGATAFAPLYLSSMFAAGNVGVGTPSPGARLEVNGNMRLTPGSGASITFADGTVQSTAYTGVTCGGDYAESIDATGDRNSYEPGDVLVIDPDAAGKFLKSAEPYSTGVTGIYSTKPGVIGRRQTTSKSTDEIPMAMLGIVPVKVSAENGPIHPGDLLVTASMPGYAMKGTDHNRMLGAVIGKALGHLNSGLGNIEAVVALQ